jgi:hypothetical protein
MRLKNTFDILLLIVRPAAGKSEIIDYLKRTARAGRVRRFHIGEFSEIDDFPMLWSWFEEDALLAEMGFPCLHTAAEGYFLGNHLWDLLVRRICLEYRKQQRPAAGKAAPATTILEFSRGKEHGGYASAFDSLSRKVMEKLAILYVNVSWAESLRKNCQRFNPQRPDSILEHGLSDDKLEKLYKENDWGEVSAADPHFVAIQGRRVPYVVFENEDDVTTGRGDPLGARLEVYLGRLWELYGESNKEEKGAFISVLM